MSLLEVQDIHTYYQDSYVLQGVSLKVEKGTVVVILGRNGVGKTTLIRSIIGFNPPRRGKIIYQGQDITHQESFRSVRLGIGLVPQGRRIFSSLTVKENIEIAAQKQGASPWTLDRLLSLFPQLRGRLYTRGGKLSGGEQQMLACSRALIGNPDLLLMDEPSEGLSPIVIQEIGQIIDEIKARGLSILLVEQNFSFALKLADYVYVMSKGTIVYESEPKELWENIEIKSSYLGI
jgi:branched-chain amino acid transport system ATP-binding protein